jgi:phosphatidylglycerophosphate synthase
MTHEIPPFPTVDEAIEQTPVEVQDHIANIPIAMTGARVVLGGMAAVKLIRGERGASALVGLMAASDMDGRVARFIDKLSIEKTGQRNGYGTTELGKVADPIADTISFLEVAPAILASPRASFLGKAAVGITLAGETFKGTWALRANHAHQAMYGEKLTVDVSDTGKEGAAARFAAVFGAALTHDLEPGKARTAAGFAALGAAITGAILGEKARRGYGKELREEKGIVVNMIPAFLRRRGRKSGTTEMAA